MSNFVTSEHDVYFFISILIIFYEYVAVQNYIYNLKYLNTTNFKKIKKKLDNIAQHIFIIKFQIVYNIFKY